MSDESYVKMMKSLQIIGYPQSDMMQFHQSIVVFWSFVLNMSPFWDNIKINREVLWLKIVYTLHGIGILIVLPFVSLQMASLGLKPCILLGTICHETACHIVLQFTHCIR